MSMRFDSFDLNSKLAFYPIQFQKHARLRCIIAVQIARRAIAQSVQIKCAHRVRASIWRIVEVTFNGIVMWLKRLIRVSWMWII